MLRDIMIGQYFPGASILHRLDPRLKIISLLFLISGVFLADSALSYAALSVLALLLTWLSRVPCRLMLRAVKPIGLIVVFTAAVHLFTTPGETLASLGVFTVTKEGARQAVCMSLRLLLLFVLSSLLTFTTTPITLTDALERIMRPFARFGLPAHELAMMMTIALRFIPTFLEETERIVKAQEARGADFAAGGILRRVKSMTPLLVPLFISAFRRADDLAAAMEARCYRGGEGRSRMRILTLKKRDFAALTFCVLFTGMLAAMRWMEF